MRDYDVTGVQTCALPISDVNGNRDDDCGIRTDAVRPPRKYEGIRLQSAGDAFNNTGNQLAAGNDVLHNPGDCVYSRSGGPQQAIGSNTLVDGEAPVATRASQVEVIAEWRSRRRFRRHYFPQMCSHGNRLQVRHRG